MKVYDHMQTEALRAPLRQVAAQLCPDVPKLLVGNVEMLNIKCGERGRNRTYNLLIKSQLLCQLSYAPLMIWPFFSTV